jgi:cyclic beta-1,2-glucan synthetase
MEQHGKNLAASHKLRKGNPPDMLLGRLKSNEKILNEVHVILMDAVEGKRRITPAGEWLLDNFYLIEDQIHTSKRHLPKGYSRELPCLQNGKSFGLPRVYSIALEIISHGDGRVDPENLSRFIAAYQTVSILKLGELWAIPIMLRLALIENLYRVARVIAVSTADRDLADKWADKISDTAKKDPKNLISVVADMANSKLNLTSTFVAELARRMQGRSSVFTLPMSWIEQKLAESGLTVEQMVQVVNQQLAADQVSISNSITSLRLLGAIDWREFVEKMSLVENIMLSDPAGFYGRMSFETRDRYRHVVERIAKNSILSETDVAKLAIKMAYAGTLDKQNSERKRHVGFYLIDKGLKELETETHTHVSITQSIQRRGLQFPLFVYLGSITYLSVFFALILLSGIQDGSLDHWLFAGLSILALLGTSHLAIALVNWLATVLATPYPLPGMDFSEGIPKEARTLVVTPTMLTGKQNIEDLAEALEVRFLANQDNNLHFGILTDFLDAKKEVMQGDEELVDYAEELINELNKKYPRPGSDSFFLFHRPRLWNPGEKIWMGYERKRGKLSALNGLLRGASAGSFSRIAGDTAILLKVKYVITLDTDTQLPRDAARELAGAMMHPFNRARYDDRKQRVIEGYGILQPRVSVSLPGANRSRYAKMYGSDAGIDPYTNAVSDVYQDWFQEGSFIGKGIYDVDVFQLALNGRFPENKILSHDLLEGCYARSGLLSNVQLYEEYPASYMSDVSRRYRWIRGDWQIGRWLLPLVPGLDGKRRKNPLSALSVWKLFDNLRRSMAPAAITLLFLLGWTVLLSPLFCTITLTAFLLIPALAASFLNLLRKSEDVTWFRHISGSLYVTGQNLLQAVFTIICLPFEAYYSMEAMLRTLWRLKISRRRLLEWTTSGDIKSNGRPHLLVFYRMMLIAPLISASAAVYLTLTSLTALSVAAPILMLWFSSPAIAWWLSKPLIQKESRLTGDQKLFLRSVARKTWLFFETFVGPDDNWLPPDNVQEHPDVKVAHRTSPTNIGMSLLANLAAYDFGYIQAGRLVERTENAFRTMELLERYHGHFYNWYDTRSLRILHPPYISSVDSGNLAGHLLTLQAGLTGLIEEPVVSKGWLEGMNDTLKILGGNKQIALTESFSIFNETLMSAFSDHPVTLSDLQLCVEQLVSSSQKMAFDLAEDPVQETKERVNSLVSQSIEIRKELLLFAPWLIISAGNIRVREILYGCEIPTLRKVSMLEFETFPIFEKLLLTDLLAEERDEIKIIRSLITISSQRAQDRISAILQVSKKAEAFAQIDYELFYNKTSHLLSIGYNVNEQRRDAGYYDLLASEARLCNFIGIAQGQLPQKSWFSLGRLLTAAGGDTVLISWSGSMFEYLMPLLIMPTYENTLLDQTYKAAVARQIEYGKQNGVPWGISESGYNTVDINLNYQYRAFGVPGLGFKRGLASDLVVAPYASMLALMVEPEAACLNLVKLSSIGLMGKFGFYEAIDYTPSRIPHKKESVIIQSFMAHHQGMGFLSLAYLLLNRPMQKRFESAPMFQAANLLLQERIPRNSALYSHKNKDTSELYSDTDNQISIRAHFR